MTEDKINKVGIGSGNIEEILKQRDDLEQILQEKFIKEVAILFTDICGYTFWQTT